MSKGPLFSTYRQGENRVTASMLAVFERIDLALVERLLGAASGESELQMVEFRNQDAGDESVPDASISADFRYLFEVKTERTSAVDETQLRNHLTSLAGHGCERLFVLTPDVDEPRAGRSAQGGRRARLLEQLRETEPTRSDEALSELPEASCSLSARRSFCASWCGCSKEDGSARRPPTRRSDCLSRERLRLRRSIGASTASTFARPNRSFRKPHCLTSASTDGSKDDTTGGPPANSHLSAVQLNNVEISREAAVGIRQESGDDPTSNAPLGRDVGLRDRQNGRLSALDPEGPGLLCSQAPMTMIGR